MRVNADFSQRVAVRPDEYRWVASPAAGVERMMLDRIGEEVARATTIVRFAPGSRFDAHTHGGGEEFLVLEGVFSDETGDFPAGSYVRNPIGTRHTPHTDPGCTILVKLHQFDPADRRQVHLDTHDLAFAPAGAAGVEAAILHEVPGETVRILRMSPGARLPGRDDHGGEEIFVLDGAIEDAFGRYPKGSWIRTPPGAPHAIEAPDGARLWIKTGHLAALTAA